MHAPLSLQLFGQTTLVDGRGRANRVSGKSARILAVLGLRAGSAVHKDELAEAVWDGSPPVSFRQTLDSDISVLRHRTGLGVGRGSALVTVPGGHLLAPDRVTFDLEIRRALAAEVAGADSVSVVTAARALVRDHDAVLFEGEPFWEWAQVARGEWAATLASSLLHASRGALIAGDSAFALSAASAALVAQPASETAAVQVMRAQWWLGRHNDALRTYAQLTERVQDELGVAPQRESHDTYLAVLHDKAASTSSQDAEEQLQLLLTLLRHTLDSDPGSRSPATDTGATGTAPHDLSPPGAVEP